MNRTLILAGSILATGTAPQLAAAQAAPSAPDAKALPGITVTAPTRTQRSVERTSAATEILSGDDIRRSGATTLGEALRAESSMSTEADGSSVSIRGGNRSETLYLIDGKRISVHTREVLNRIPASYVERVEITKGPASAIYGSDALAGVINVITRRPDPGLEGSVDFQTGVPTDADGGEQNHGALYLGGGTRDTRFRLFADAFEREAYSEDKTTTPLKQNGDALGFSQTFKDDRRAATDVYNLLAGVTHWFTEDFNIDLEAGFMREESQKRFVHKSPTETGDGGKAKKFAAKQTADSERRDLAATAEWLPTDSLELRYRIYESQRTMERANAFLEPQAFGFDTAADSEFAPREPTSILRVNDLLARWQPAPSHTVLTGFEHKQQISQNHVPDGEPKQDQWVASPFVQHDWQAADRLNLVYGARHNETSREEDSTSLQAGAEYRLAPEARLRAQYAEGFELPDLRMFHVDARNPRNERVLGAHVVNESLGKERHELDPESSRNYEIGIAGDLDMHQGVAASYDIALFYTEYDDRISQVRETKKYRTFKNVEDARAQGAEFQFGATFDPEIELTLGATYLDAIDRDTGDRLTGIPEWTTVAKALWAPTDSLELQLRTRYVDEVRARGDDWDSAYSLTSLDAKYAPAAWDGVTLQGGVDNLLDSDNESSLYADPGRFVRAGVRYDF